MLQATEARHHITELALDHPKWGLDLGAHLRLGLLGVGFVQRTGLIQFLVGAEASCPYDLPKH